MALLHHPAMAAGFGLALLGASVCDLAWRRVPNALNAVIAGAGLVSWGLLDGLPGLLHSLMGMAVAFALVVVPFAVRVHRGGDAKLIIAVGAWLGSAGAVWTYALGLIDGAVLAAALVAASDAPLRRQVRDNLALAALTRRLPAVPSARPARSHVPMAAAFALGAMVTVVVS